MKKVMLFVMAMFVSAAAHAYSQPISGYVEGESGILASNGSQAPIYGVRGGIGGLRGEYSVGYWAARGMRSDNLISDGLDLHVFSAEYYRVVFMGDSFRIKLGGGAGYAIPNLDSGASETADNGNSWTAGGTLEYAFSPGLSLGLGLKGFWFTTDTHITTYGSHIETLTINGVPSGQVEVLDEVHYNNHVNFNSILATVSLRWK